MSLTSGRSKIVNIDRLVQPPDRDLTEGCPAEAVRDELGADHDFIDTPVSLLIPPSSSDSVTTITDSHSDFDSDSDDSSSVTSSADIAVPSPVTQRPGPATCSAGSLWMFHRLGLDGTRGCGAQLGQLIILITFNYLTGVSWPPSDPVHQPLESTSWGRSVERRRGGSRDAGTGQTTRRLDLDSFILYSHSVFNCTFHSSHPLESPLPLFD